MSYAIWSVIHMIMFIYVIVGVLKCKVSDKFGTVQIQLLFVFMIKWLLL